MTLARSAAWTLLAAAWFALPYDRAAAQDPTKLPQFSNTGAIIDRKEGRIPDSELDAARKQFQAFARYHAELLAHPLVYKAAQDPSVKFDANGRTIPTVDGLIRELDNRFILEPAPLSKVTAEQAHYIRELGAAFDAALKPLIEGNAERIVRINAMRLYAGVCKSGATPHWPTVTALLRNANTPTEIKYYALQAAANLLSAYDVNEYRFRKHSNGPKEVGDLVDAVEECVRNPAALLNNLPTGWKPADASGDQLAVIGFVRRQAVKALAQVRFVTVPGPDGKTPLYPAYTLARVCVSDPALVPPPSPSECAEAAMGLCNMAPSVNGDPVKDFNKNAAVEAVTAALITFASPRAENLNDRSLPWRGYALRLAEALKNWRPLFDPLFDPAKPNAPINTDLMPKSLNDLIGVAQSIIFAPMGALGADGKPDPVAGRVEIAKMREFLSQLRGGDKRSPLVFMNNPATSIAFPEKK